MANALYGREYFEWSKDGGHRVGRHRDGLFSSGRYSRLGAVLIARRPRTERLFTAYDLFLFPNPAGSSPVEEVAKHRAIQEIVGPGDHP